MTALSDERLDELERQAKQSEQTARRRQRVLLGRCRDCNEAAKPGNHQCRRHLEKGRRDMAARRARNGRSSV